MEENKKNILIEHYAGSILYGTNDETSDEDIRGVFIEDLDLILTNNRRELYEDKTQEDHLLYELSKFLNLIQDNNPNLLETLFCPDEHIVYKSELWDIIRNKRHQFLSKKAITKFYGYINSQLKRMKKTNSWIRDMYSLDLEIINELGLNNQLELLDKEEHIVENIIEKKWLYRKQYNMIVHPLHSEYLNVIHNFTNDKNFNKNTPELIKELHNNCIWVKINSNTYMIYLNIGDEYKSFLKKWMIFGLNKSELNESNIDIRNLNPDLIISLNKDNYDNAIKNYNWYYSWKGTKNSNRLELQKENWYDTKFMMHIFRLYLILKDILVLQDLRVDRRGIDADFLYDVKKGKYTFEEITDVVLPELDSEINELIEEYGDKLPEESTVDIKALELEIYNRFYNI